MTPRTSPSPGRAAVHRRAGAGPAGGGDRPAIDVIHYDARIEPDIPGRSIRGAVTIRFAARRESLNERRVRLRRSDRRRSPRTGCLTRVLAARPPHVHSARPCRRERTRRARSRSSTTARRDRASSSSPTDRRSTPSFRPASGWCASTLRTTRPHFGSS